MPQYDYLDVSIVTEESAKTEVFDMPLVNAVARGRLFFLNNRGEYEKVIMATYWKDHRLFTVDGRYQYECDEDGEITRDWRREGVDH